MSHPKNRRERFLKGQSKGEKRALGLYPYEDRLKRPESFLACIRRLRNTTKLCGRPCCTNPRHNGYKDKLTRQELKENEKSRDRLIGRILGS